MRPPAAHEESRGLTGLRGAAALLVVGHHMYLVEGVSAGVVPLTTIIRHGYFAVDLFFVLSGFVLSMVYGAWFDAARPCGPVGLVRFLLRRIARLWPLHATVLTLLLLLGITLHGHSPRMVIANYLMIQAWGTSAELNPPAWSISTEFLAAFLFPAMVSAGLGRRLGPALLMLLAAVALVVCTRLDPMGVGAGRRGPLDVYANYSIWPAVRCLAGVAVGIVAWRLGQIACVRRWAATPWLGAGAVALLLLGMSAGVHDLLLYPLLPAAVLGLHLGRGPGWLLFAAGPMHWLGTVSYPLYLVHYALLQVAPRPWTNVPVSLAAYLAVTLAVAWAAHWLVERPGQRLIRRAGEAALAVLRRPAPAGG